MLSRRFSLRYGSRPSFPFRPVFFLRIFPGPVTCPVSFMAFPLGWRFTGPSRFSAKTQRSPRLGAHGWASGLNSRATSPIYFTNVTIWSRPCHFLWLLEGIHSGLSAPKPSDRKGGSTRQRALDRRSAKQKFFRRTLFAALGATYGTPTGQGATLFKAIGPNFRPLFGRSRAKEGLLFQSQKGLTPIFQTIPIFLKISIFKSGHSPLAGSKPNFLPIIMKRFFRKAASVSDWGVPRKREIIRISFLL